MLFFYETLFQQGKRSALDEFEFFDGTQQDSF